MYFNKKAIISVVNADYMGEYKIHIGFNDGKQGKIDFKEIITDDHRPIFNQLKDISIFKNFKIDFATLVWPNELDITPEFLYFKAFTHDPLLKQQFEECGYIH